MMTTYKRNFFTTDHAINSEIEGIHDALHNGAIEWRKFSTPELLETVNGFKDEDISFILMDLLSGKSAGHYAEGVIQIPIGDIEVQFEGEAEAFFDDVSDWTIDGDLAYASLPSIAFDCDLDELKTALTEWAAV
jgi:hypothetical protein